VSDNYVLAIIGAGGVVSLLLVFMLLTFLVIGIR
jgi:pilus assembly protein TadC